MLNDCYKYDAAINAKGEPLLMALLLSQHKVINRLTELISKQKSLDSNNKEVKESKEVEQELGRENKHDYLRMKEFITMMISSKREIVHSNLS